VLPMLGGAACCALTGPGVPRARAIATAATLRYNPRFVLMYVLRFD
jgi:hypothetical protein